MKILLFALVCLTLGGCANFAGTSQSVWSDGLWILPWLTGIGAVIFLVSAIIGSKSGTEQQIRGTGTVYSDENEPFWTSPRCWWFCGILALATIVIIIAVVSSR